VREIRSMKMRVIVRMWRCDCDGIVRGRFASSWGPLLGGCKRSEGFGFLVSRLKETRLRVVVGIIEAVLALGLLC